MTLHSEIVPDSIHVIHNWSYADATARTAATGFSAGDVGKIAWQRDTESLWILTDDSPITWIAVSPGSAAVISVNTHTGAVVLASDDISDTAQTHKFTTSAEITKLSGIATGATANSSDATLLARANHTGTQSADTLTDGTTNKAFLATERTKLSGIEALADVTDATNVEAAGAVMESDTSTAAMSFVIDQDSMATNSDTKVPTQQSVKAYVDAVPVYTDEMARDALGTALVAGNNIDITVDDAGNTITIDVESLTSSDIGDFSEAVDDRVAALLIAGNNVDVTYDDVSNTLTIDVEALTESDIASLVSDLSTLTSAVAGKQAADSDLTTIASLTATTDNVIQSVASAWASRTPAQLKSTLALAKADVGLGSVDNTADSAKPVSTAQQTALDGKQPIDTDLTTIAALSATTDNVIQSVASAWASRTPAQLKSSMSFVKADVGLGNVDNTADSAKPVSVAQQTALDLKAPLASPTFTGTVTLPVGLTGILRADTGVVSVDTLTASDVTDFSDAVAAAVVATVSTGTGLSTVLQFGPDSMEISLDLTYVAELIRDTIGTSLTAGENVSITVDDAANTITIDVTPVITVQADGVDLDNAITTLNFDSSFEVTTDDAGTVTVGLNAETLTALSVDGYINRETEIDIPAPSYSFRIDVDDDNITEDSIVWVQQSGKGNSLGGSPDENEADLLMFSANPWNGGFTVFGQAIPGPVMGTYVIQYRAAVAA